MLRVIGRWRLRNKNTHTHKGKNQEIGKPHYKLFQTNVTQAMSVRKHLAQHTMAAAKHLITQGVCKKQKQKQCV